MSDPKLAALSGIHALATEAGLIDSTNDGDWHGVTGDLKRFADLCLEQAGIEKMHYERWLQEAEKKLHEVEKMLTEAVRLAAVIEREKPYFRVYAAQDWEVCLERLVSIVKVAHARIEQ